MNVEKVISPVKGKHSMEVHSSISQTYLVSYGSVGLGSNSGGVHLPWVSVHFSICETYLV